MNKNLYIISGCNGAGKTTASFTLLPEILNCKEFVNADEIARGLSPFQPETVSFEAGRIMLHRINELLKNEVSFAFETTLATRSYKGKILKAKENGYIVTLVFFWLQNVELAIERVKARVMKGGHNIPEDVIRRRYTLGIKNLFEIYLPIADEMLIFDNSDGKYEMIATGKPGTDFVVLNESKFNKLKKLYEAIL